MAADVLDGDGDRRVAVIRRAARQHLVHDDAEGIQVRAAVDLRALGLLGRDIVDGAEGFARERILRRRDAGDAEIGDLDAAVLQDHDVVGLDVAVDDAACSSALQICVEKCRASRQLSVPFCSIYCLRVMPSMSSMTI